MKTITLKFGEHIVNLNTENDFNLKIENNDAYVTDVYVMKDYKQKNKSGFIDDSLLLDDDEIDMLIEDENDTLSENERIDIGAALHVDNNYETDMFVNHYDDVKPVNDSIYDEMQKQDALLTNDIVLNGDTPQFEDEYKDFKSSIDETIKNEREFLNSEKVVVSSKKQFEDVSVDDEEDVDSDVIDDNDSNSEDNSGNSDPDLMDDDDLINNNNVENEAQSFLLNDDEDDDEDE